MSVTTTDQTFSTHDLRSAAVDYQRDHDQKAKWAHGQAWGPGRSLEDLEHARPARPDNREAPGMRRDGVSIATHKARARQGRKRDIQVDYVSGDSSADDEVEEHSAAPEPDAEITYSFDASRGPSHGSQILSVALDKAIERFEVHATDKLIKDEYEVLGLDGEPVVTRSKGKKATMHPHDEEDFELI